MSKRTIILISFLALKFLLQYLLLSPSYDLQRDEYLHLDQANHLAWGFHSVPPFSSWIAYLIQLLGNSLFWIKFFPALYGALTILVVWKTIETLDGTLFALILGASCVLFSALLRINTLYQPNSFDVLSWTAFYFTLVKYLKSEKPKWLYVGALVFALGFLNKYNIGFLILGLIPSILLTNKRRLFLQPKLNLAAGMGLLLLLPNLIWQYQHNFPVIHHMKELADTQLVNVDRLNFLKSQLLFFMGAIFVILSGLYALLTYKPFKPYRLFFWALPLTLAIFMYFKAKDYYAIGLYPIYIAFGSVYLGTILREGWKKYLQPVAIAIPVLLLLPILNVAFPNKSPEYIIQHQDNYKKFGLLRWEDGKDHLLPQDFADMLGWKELASKVDSLYAKLPSNTLVLCDNYGQAGAINYYTKQKIRAVSFNADYINWFDLSKNYQNLIRIKEEEAARSELQETSPYFQQSIVADSITNKYAREFGTTIFVFVGAKVDMRERIKKEISEE